MTRALGWSKGRLGNYESGKRRPSVADLRALSAVLNVDLLAILSDTKGDNYSSEIKERRSIPLFTLDQFGAMGTVADISEIAGKATVEVDATTTPLGAIAITLEGDSMVNSMGTPSFPPGTVIVLDPNLDPAPDKFVAAFDPQTGKPTFKRLVYDAGRWFLKPLNNAYPTIPIEDPNDILIGVAIEWQMRGKL